MKQFVLTAAIMCASVTLQAWPLQSAGDVAFTVDGAAFSSGDGLVWQELYWSFPANGFASVETLNLRLSRFRTAISLTDSAGAVRLSEDWNTVAPMPSAAELKRKNLVRLDQIGVRNLKPGSYRLSFSITDAVSGRQGTLDAGIVVPTIPAGRPALSQIELASEIKPDSTEKRFRKGALKVLPNPVRIFGEGSAVYYYFEIYGLVNPAGNRLKVSYISDNDSTTGIVAVDSLDGIRGQAVRTGGFELEGMPDGGYQLWAQLVDKQDRLLAATSASFRIARNPLAAMPGAGSILVEQQALQKQGGQYYDRIEYLASGRELDRYRKLDSLGQREFLRQFWKARDTDSATPENEVLREHARRYEYANSTFGEKIRKGMEGSQTDRGRIYIKFGEPGEIVSKPIQPNHKPVIIWRYPGSKKFIFVDLGGYGQFQLVYTNFSATSGERSDPRYDSMLSLELMEAEDIGIRGREVNDPYNKW